MATVFTRIIEGELPARFVWSDDRAVAFLSINPLRPGHLLLVPRAEVEHWVDLEPDDWVHLSSAAQRLGVAVQRAYPEADKVGMVLAGFEVPHVHVHLIPARTMEDFDFARAETDPDPGGLEEAAGRLRAALRDLGEEGVRE